MGTRIVSVLVLVIALCGFVATSGHAGSAKHDIETLRGIKGISVVVEDIDDDVTKDGLSKDTIINDVELRLRQNGINVVSEEGILKIAGSPFLYLCINTLKLEPINSYTYSITIELRQMTKLIRNNSLTVSGTWNIGSLGIAKANNLSYIRDRIKDKVDIFINNYLSVNPKK